MASSIIDGYFSDAATIVNGKAPVDALRRTNSPNPAGDRKSSVSTIPPVPPIDASKVPIRRQDGRSPPETLHKKVDPDDELHSAVTIPSSDDDIHGLVTESIHASSDGYLSSDDKLGPTDNGYETTCSDLPRHNRTTSHPRPSQTPKPIPTKSTQPPYHMTIFTRLCYTAILMFPLIGAVGIFAATCAPFFWYRAHLSINQISIPAGQWNIDQNSTSSLNMNAGGVLTVAIWGWCFEATGNNVATCSATKLWYDMSAFFEQAGDTTTTLTGGAFNVNLIRALITHIIAGGLAVIALGLVTWHIYARCFVNDNRVDPNWLQQASCFIAFCAALTAYIVDLLCRKSISKHCPNDFVVEQGSIPYFTLIAFLLVLSAFVASSLQVFWVNLRRKHSYGHYKTSRSDSSAGLIAMQGAVTDSDEDDEVDRHLSRRRSVWQRGLSQMQRHPRARVRTRHRGVGSDGATRLVERVPNGEAYRHHEKGYNKPEARNKERTHY